MWSWFEAKECEAFGVSLAHFFIVRMPLDTFRRKAKSPIHKQEVLKKMFLQAARFGKTHKMNIYKKAKLGNAFKWELKNAGYEPELINELTTALMQRI